MLYFAVQNLHACTGIYRKTAPGVSVAEEAPEAAGTTDILALLCLLLPSAPPCAVLGGPDGLCLVKFHFQSRPVPRRSVGFAFLFSVFIQSTFWRSESSLECRGLVQDRK